jgi:hypothetical protein
MRVVVEGCCHGELDKIYHTIEEIEQVIHDKIDLLLICGDFQVFLYFNGLILYTLLFITQSLLLGREKSE